MRRFAIVCLIFSSTFLGLLLIGALLPQDPPVNSQLNRQFREIRELKADFDRIGQRLDRISRGGKRMGATTEETPEPQAPDTPTEEESAEETTTIPES